MRKNSQGDIAFAAQRDCVSFVCLSAFLFIFTGFPLIAPQLFSKKNANSSLETQRSTDFHSVGGSKRKGFVRFSLQAVGPKVDDELLQPVVHRCDL